MRKGEFVVIIEGVVMSEKSQADIQEQERILRILLTECSIRTAVSMAVEITGGRKKDLYQMALRWDKD